MTEKEIPELPDVPTLLFEAPLYSSFALKDIAQRSMLVKQRTTSHSGRIPTISLNEFRADAYCPECEKESTFHIHPDVIENSEYGILSEHTRSLTVRATCARKYHVQRFFVLLENAKIVTKVGQFPSLADIAIDEVQQKYRAVLKGDNWTEMRKAIGLAAHGEGIGSFVYLRRIFERLVRQRFDAHKADERWTEGDFVGRMGEKIEMLSKHLPPFLVEHKRLYGIFSKGIHELANDECLAFFEAGKAAIIIILEEDERARQDAETRTNLSKAIQAFDAKAGRK